MASFRVVSPLWCGSGHACSSNDGGSGVVINKDGAERMDCERWGSGGIPIHLINQLKMCAEAHLRHGRRVPELSQGRARWGRVGSDDV